MFSHSVCRATNCKAIASTPPKSQLDYLSNAHDQLQAYAHICVHLKISFLIRTGVRISILVGVSVLALRGGTQCLTCMPGTRMNINVMLSEPTKYML